MPVAGHDREGQWRALLRRPGYLGFVLTVSLSRIAGAMFITSGVLLVLARTGSPSTAGLTAAAATLPGAIAGPFLGALLDVATRRRTLIVADQLLTVVALAALEALAGHAANWTLPLVAVLYGATRPISVGSFISALAEVAGADLLDRASAVEATSLNLGIVIGPAVAGVLVGLFGAGPVIELQAGLTVVVAALIAVNPVFDARPAAIAPSVREALRAGTRALRDDRLLRDISVASLLANLSWGLMTIGFPLYAAQRLHAGSHASGYLWAAVAAGSIVGTFALAGQASPRRVAVSYAALALSALAWPLAGTLTAGVVLIGLTGVLEGPAYSSTIALRQRRAPEVARGQVMNTLGSLGAGALAAGAAIGGALHDPSATILAFVGVNLAAALIAARSRGFK